MPGDFEAAFATWASISITTVLSPADVVAGVDDGAEVELDRLSAMLMSGAAPVMPGAGVDEMRGDRHEPRRQTDR